MLPIEDSVNRTADVLLLVTVINGQEVYACALSVFSVISVVLFYDYNAYDWKVFLSSQLFCFELMIDVNLVTELLYSDGMHVLNSSFLEPVIIGFWDFITIIRNIIFRY